MMQKQLQQILGTDKRNPSFTIFRNSNTEYLHVYYGGDMFEKVPDDRDDPQYKLMVARLYNANVNATKLSEAFKVDPKTMRCWGDALKSGDPEKLIRVLAGRQAHRKFTIEIQAFVRMRFPVIYKENPSSYSKQIRKEIADVYGENLCGETLRGFLKSLKDKIGNDTDDETGKRETDCECISELKVINELEAEDTQRIADDNEIMDDSTVRNGSPVSIKPSKESVHFVHHLGVLLFSPILLKIDELISDDNWVIKQWLTTIFLGVVNIEQSKLLDFKGLEMILGKTLRSHRPQRLQLNSLGKTDVAKKLLLFNAQEINIPDCSDFYYDPHEKHCTTRKHRILKSWCGSKHLTDKVLHMDFIHTNAGHPAYIAYEDNFNDLRERFNRTLKSLRSTLNIDNQRVLTVVFDRGIFGKEVFKDIIKDKNMHVVTWEKDYKKGAWNEKEIKGTFSIERCRNNAEDIKKYTFKYMDESWEKDEDMRLIRVRATNPNGRTIELGILTDDKTRSAEDLITLMFKRWVQENDFKYLNKHFGINQITSYATVSYKDLRDQVEDKEMKSGDYKALQKERQIMRKRLKQMLFNEHQHPGKSPDRQKKIKDLTSLDENITERIGQTEKDVSRLEYLIEENYQRLNTSNKGVMDALKLIARNIFYKSLQPFRKEYNNYRDDHTLFRNLTHAHGIMIDDKNQVEIQLYPTAHYPPKLRKIIENVFNDMNADSPRMPDGSNRRIVFKLGKNTGIELANRN